MQKHLRTTLGYEAERGELKKDSCCCGATKKNPCECMYEGVMNCSATSPMCPCYKAINKGVTDKYWGDIAKAPPWDTGFWAESFEAQYFIGKEGYFIGSEKERKALGKRIIIESDDLKDFGEPDWKHIENAGKALVKGDFKALRHSMGMLDSVPLRLMTDAFGSDFEKVISPKKIEQLHLYLDAESFEASATSCFECGRFGYDDEMMRIDYGYLCARCSNPDVDFSKIMSAEDSKKINKKFIGLLGIGALGAYFAPREIKKLFDNMKKS